ncbi:MAG TPA: DUF6364 family protein [Cryomorphaceae bacterium]|nr:DUF6364 family protein [Cryomorphaceae bacterium]
MDAKLTLKLNQEVIKKAKEYASENNSSLSRLVENYLSMLVENKSSSEIEISPFVKSISSGVQIPTDVDERKAYRDHLEDKYK